MNDDQRMEASEHYFRQYRDKLRRAEDLESRRNELDEAYRKDRDHLSAQMINLKNELESMRRVITRVVEEGIDPTTAKVMMDETYNRDIWVGDPFSTTGYGSISTVDISDQLDPRFGSRTTIGSISLGNIGAIGATGATGSDVYVFDGQGANGPGGPNG